MSGEIKTRGRPSSAKYCYIEWQPVQRDHWNVLVNSKISELRSKCAEGSSNAPKVDLRGYTIIKGILDGKMAVLSGKDAPNLITTVRDLEYEMLTRFLESPQVGESPSELSGLESQTAKLKLYDIGKLLGHTQLSTTSRYAHLQADRQLEAVNSIGRLAVLHEEEMHPAGPAYNDNHKQDAA